MSPEGPSYEADPEVRLMSRVAAGDDAAFDPLVRRVIEPLTAFMTRQTGDPDRAADLVQETLLRAFRARKTYRPDARFRTWLFRIASNVTLNRIRYDGYRAATSLDAETGAEGVALGARLPDARAPEPSAGLEQGELRDRVRAAVLALPANQRVAVTLLRFHELSYEEIASAMSLSLQAVKSLLNRAKENLRRALAPEIGARLDVGTVAERGVT
ncbi:MAG TPA: sigma-70 family RNA polymerase sigma factor [Planctomycetota bacterium]|nr:sigma-70 family RNA polymerase sigma factor [Planctomycetota bacterium]